MPTDRPNQRGFTASSAPTSSLRPVDYFLLGVCIVALIAVGVVAARGSSQAQRTASAEREANKLAASVQELEKQVQQLNGELQTLRGVNSRLTTLESRANEPVTVSSDEVRKQVREIADEEMRSRQEQLRADLDRRGEELMNRMANDKRLEQGLRDAAERMRKQTKVEQAAPKEEKTAEAPPPPDAVANAADQQKQNDPIQVGVAKGAETLAEGLKLWRDFQDGKITQAEFDAQRKGLEENFRAAFEKTMTPEQREQMQKRIQEWRERRQGGGGGAVKPPPPVDEKF